MDTGTAILLAACAPVVNQWVTSYMHHRSEKRDLIRSQRIATKAEEVAVETQAKVDAVHEAIKQMGTTEHKDEMVPPRF